MSTLSQQCNSEGLASCICDPTLGCKYWEWVFSVGNACGLDSMSGYTRRARWLAHLGQQGMSSALSEGGKQNNLDDCPGQVSHHACWSVHAVRRAWLAHRTWKDFLNLE